MKNIYKLFVAIAALFLVSCQTAVLEPAQDITDSPDTKPVAEEFKVVTIVAGKEQTKTSYAGETEFSWSVGDQVSVIFNNGTNSQWVPFTTAIAAASCKFTSSPVPSSYEMGSLGGRRLALYPASGDHEFTDDTNIRYYMPGLRDFRASAGGHPETAIPMFGEGFDNDSYTFHNMTGAVKFTFENVPSSEVKFVFTSAGEKKMNGLFPLTGLEDNASSVSWNPGDAANEAEKKLTFCADVDPTAHSVSFYVPYVGTLPPGCHVELRDAEESVVLFDRTTVSDLVVEKNRITVVPVQDVAPGTPHPVNLVHLDQDVRNPERGFTDSNVLEYNGTTFPSGLYNVDDNNSLVFIRFDLTGYKTGNLTETALNAIRSVFSEVRYQGKKAVIRFIYTTANKDVPLSIVNDHLLKLKDVFVDFQDVIYVVQAGFIGKVGEWNQSNYFDFSGYPSNYGIEVADSYFADQSDVVDELLAAVPASRQIALRTPRYKRYYTRYKGYFTSCWDWNPITSFDGTDYNSRITFHNDGFAGNVGNGGTFADYHTPYGDPAPVGNVDRRMWYSQSAYLACGGETYSTAPDPVYSQFPAAKQALYDQHISYLGDNRGSSCLRDLTDTQIEELRKCMGYHLWLKEAKIYYSDSDPDALAAGKPLTVFCKLENNGAAPVIYQRPMKLVLLRGDNATVLAHNMGDVRMVAPNGGVRSFFAKFTIPAGGIQSGDKLALWLPDVSATIADRAVYAIHLANDHSTDDTEWVTFPGPDPSDPAQATGGYNVFYTF